MAGRNLLGIAVPRPTFPPRKRNNCWAVNIVEGALDQVNESLPLEDRMLWKTAAKRPIGWPVHHESKAELPDLGWPGSRRATPRKAYFELSDRCSWDIGSDISKQNKHSLRRR